MRVRTGVEGLDAILGGGLPEAMCVLLQGPPGNEKELIGLQFLAEGLRSGGAVVILLGSRSPELYLDSLSKQGVNVERAIAGDRLKIVDWYLHRRQSVAGLEERGHVIRCSADLSDVGVALGRALAALAIGVPHRALLDVLSPALDLYEVGRVTAFAQSSRAKLMRQKVTGLYLLETGARDSATVTSLGRSFDAVIDIQRASGGDVEARTIRVASATKALSDKNAHELVVLQGQGVAVLPTGRERGAVPPRSDRERVSAQDAHPISRVPPEIDRKGQDALFAKASALAARQDLWAAIDSLDLLCEVNDAYPGLWTLRADLFARIGDPQMAQESRQKADDLARQKEPSTRSSRPQSCPLCTVVVPVDANECPNCGAKLTRKTGFEARLASIGNGKARDRGDTKERRLHVREFSDSPDRVVEPGHLPSSNPTDSGPETQATAPRPETHSTARDSPRSSRGRTTGGGEEPQGRPAAATKGPRGRGGHTNTLRGGPHTNGMAEGLAAVRRSLGDGLTNGNGFTNGLGAARFRHEAALSRWKLYVIPLLSLSLLTLPLFAPMSPEGRRYPISIDGDVSDWSPAAFAHQAPRTGLNPNVEILRFAIADNVDSLALVAEVNGTALRGGDSPPTMDTFRFFLDTDRDVATGYRVDGLGADHLLEISGWRGGVNVSSLYEWDGNRNSSDWRGWVRATYASAAVEAGHLEAEVDWLAIASPVAGVFVTLHTQGFDGSVDVADYAVNSRGGSVSIEQEIVVPQTLVGANVPILRLTLSAHGATVNLSGIAVTLMGSAPVNSMSSLRLVADNASVVDEKTPTARRVPFRFPELGLAVGTVVRLSVIGNVTSASGETLAAIVGGSGDIVAPGAVVTVREVAPVRDVGYLGAPPPVPRIDGGFSEWTSPTSDPVGDVVGPTDPSVDLSGFQASRVGNASFFFAQVAGRFMAGTWVPKGNDVAIVNVRSEPDQDRDGVPDSVDPLPYDFNNDGIPDSQTQGDYDGDRILDYGQPGGTDWWLNTTIPASFPPPYANRQVSVYIGPTQEPMRSRDDILRIFADLDNNSWSGYSIGGIGADRMVEVSGAAGRVNSAGLAVFTGSFPGQWSWQHLSNASFGLGFQRLELATSANLTPSGSRLYVEIGGQLGSRDSLSAATRGTRGDTAGHALALDDQRSSFDQAPAALPQSLPWNANPGGTRGSTLLDPNSNAISTLYNHQRKVVRAGDVPSDSACDATNSDGCWYVVFYDQLLEATSNTQASTETVTTGTRVTGTFPSAIQAQDGVYIQYRESRDSAEAMAAYRSNTGTFTVSSPKNRTSDGSSWSADTEQATAGSPIRQVRMAYSPRTSSERIFVTLSDDGLLDAYVCNPSCGVTNNIGQVWSTAPAAPDTRFDIAYEQASGDALLVYGVLSTDTTRDIAYRTYVGGTWSAEQYLDDTGHSTDVQYTVIGLASKRGSDQIGLIGGDATNNDVNAWIWGGTSFGSFTEITPTAAAPSRERAAIAWESNSGDLLAVGQEASVNIVWKQYTTSWSSASTYQCASTGSQGRWLRLKPDPVQTADRMILTDLDDLAALNTCYWNGSGWANFQTHDGATDTAATRVADFAWESTGGKGLLVWGTTSAQIAYRAFTAPNTWGSTSNAAMGSNPHSWVTLRTNPFPRTGAAKIAGAVMETTANDLGAIRWDGTTFSVIGASTFTADTGTTTDESYDLRYHATNDDQALVRYDWTGIPTADSYILQIKGYREDEDVNVQVLTPPSTWMTRIAISATANTLYSVSLTASEYNSGAPSIRFTDAAGAGGMQSDFWVDYANVVANAQWDRVIIMRSSDISGSAWGSQITLASGRASDNALVTAYDSAEPSIAMDSSGYLHIAWVSAGSQGNQQTLNRVRYTQTIVAYPTQSELATGTNWQSVTVVDDANLGYMPTVSTDSNNAPHIAWSSSKIGGTIYYKNKVGGAWKPTVSWGTSNSGASVDVAPLNNYVSLAPLASPSAGWWDASYQYRQRINITTGSAAAPAGESVGVTLNHASLAAEGRSRADGDDVRAVYWTGSSWTELDRVLEDESAWNSTSTTLWLKTQAAIGAGSWDNNYYLYYGQPTATSPPADKANVYLFYDDFESGTLDKWTVANGTWQTANDEPRGGIYSLKYVPDGLFDDRFIYANPALDDSNLYFEAWWRFSSLESTDIAQLFRRPAGAQSGYETNKELTTGWDIAKEINGVWTELSPNAGTPVANTWTRIGTAIFGTGMRVFKDGAQINPASGSFDVGTELTSGNVGFRKASVGAGFAWWIDDVIVRRYVDPQPTTSLAAEESQPNEVRYWVCKDLSASNCDASSEFTKSNGSAGFDAVATQVESASYPSLATTYDGNGDLWIAYAKDVSSGTRATYARFLDYPTAGWASAETIDSLSGTIFTKPSIGIDRNNNPHALYVSASGSQLYYNIRSGGSWGVRQSVGTFSDNPTVMVRTPNDATYGGSIGGVYWETSASETYFFVPEFPTLVVPVAFTILLVWASRRQTGRVGRNPRR